MGRLLRGFEIVVLLWPDTPVISVLVCELQVASSTGWIRSRFLSRVSTLTRDIDIAILSICPSVCPSVHDTLVLCENGLKYCYSFFTIGSPIILVLPASRWGIKIQRFSTNKSLYLANDTRYRYSYSGRRIGTRM